ncbi:MAG: hypothetical protein OER82_00350 [Nitrosopumilus sp.]|nr:hypothetical protein [Nitrosopumilus sp.]
MSFSFTPSHSLTESVDLFGQINSADIVLNDIWIEPENPKYGEAVSIHGSVYNAGIIPTEKVSNVITIGYIVNDELVEIALLENVSPGVENGTIISSGPVLDSRSGNYIITVIINYHDTLSHLRDNPENNIIQKRIQIGSNNPSLITYDINQQYDSKTGQQQIKIQGELTNVYQEKVRDEEIIVNVKGILKEKTTTDGNGEFFFETHMPFKNELIEITTQLEVDTFFSNPTQVIFPIKLSSEQSALALEIISDTSESDIKNQVLTAVVFQDSYDELFKKVSTDNYDKQDLFIENFILSTLPANHKYIVEVYIGGRILDAFQNYFPNNQVIKKEISISESAQIQFKITDKAGEPQNNVKVENWIYLSTSNEYGITEWIDVLPTFTENEPYVAKAIFTNGEIVWSEPFQIEEGEKKTIHIIKGDN